MSEAIPFAMLVASRLKFQGDTNNRGHIARKSLIVTLPKFVHWLSRRFATLARHRFGAAGHENLEQHKDAGYL